MKRTFNLLSSFAKASADLSAENPKFERRKEPKRMGAKKSFMRRGLNRKDAKTRRVLRTLARGR